MDRAAGTALDDPCGPSFAGGLAQIAAGLDEILAAELTPANADAARVIVAAFEAQHRRADAVAIKILDAVGQSGTHRLDGHRSAKVMVRHLGRLSGATALRRDQAARALRDLPGLAAAFEAGLVSADKVAVVARAYANERIRAAVIDADDTIVERATDPNSDYRDFDHTIRAWADLIDEDGAGDRFQRTHRNRDARLQQDFDGSWTLTGGCGANNGAELETIFERFCDEQFQADWAEAKERLGTDDIAVSDLRRSAAQRRFDAMLEMARRAASTLPGDSGSQVITNLVMDLATFERHAARYATANMGPTPGTDRTAPDANGQRAQPAEDPFRADYRCETIDGHPIDPAAAVADALIGHIRRVVVDTKGVTINLSRKSRFFRDLAALAARFTTTACSWPGCWHPVTDCQIDHMIPWGDHGESNQDNATPCCGHHNRLRTKGYRIERLDDGTIAVHDPHRRRIT